MLNKPTYEELINRIIELEQSEIQRAKVEKALRESERHLSTLLENLPGISYRCKNDEDWTMLYISKGSETLTGYHPSELINNNSVSYNSLIVQEDRQYIYDEIQDAINKDRSFTIEYRIIDKNNNEKWVWEKGIAVQEYENGELILEGFINDISVRKRTEEALKTSHERFLTVLNSIDAAIHVIDLETYEILFINEYLTKSFGKDLTGETCWNVFKKESGPCPFCNFNKLFNEDGTPSDVHIWHDKNPVTGEWNIRYDRIIEWTNGHPVRLQIATDITELKRMEEELRQAHKMEAIGTLAGGIAHEFNNILGIILGNAELAMDDIPKWNPTYEFLSEVQTASMRGKDVVKQLLSFSHKSSNKKHPLDLVKTVKDSIGFLRASIPSIIQFRERLPEKCPAVIADETEINQILINLCNNASQAMEDNGGTLEIALEYQVVEKRRSFIDQILIPGEYVRLGVSDTGHGIPSGVIERIFDPFYTTKDVNKGSGLGLAVVHGIIKNHNAFIDIESKTGNGTKVFCYFPVTYSASVKMPKKIEQLPRGSESILFIDDEESLVKTCREHLERLGYQVETKTDPLEALAHFKVNPEKFTLVISDMTMPYMTGDKLIKEMIGIKPDVKTIICTGNSEKVNEETAPAIGASGFVMKPIDRETLAKTVRNILDKT
jgi:PAS domain S-box-containing protein